VVVAKPNITTTYTVTGTDNFGGVSTATITVKVNPLPDITVTPNPAKLFVGDAVQLHATGAANYSWSPATGLSSTNGAIVTANPVLTTTYFVRGTDLNGCVGIDTVQVNVFPKPQVKVTPSSATICKGGSVRLTASGASTYNWHPSVGLSPTNTSIVTAFPSTTTTYTVIGTDVNGGIDSTTITVNVTDQLESPIVRTVAGNATSLTFGWDAIPGAGGYQVSMDSGQTYTNPSSGFNGLTHTVTGLAVGQTVVIYVRAVGDCESQPTRYAATSGNFEFYVPNAFTPNDDGKNDVFLIYGPNFKSMKMRIYNQWGQIVFESAEARQGWDGRMNGVKQPSGVYAYYLEVVLFDGRKQVYKGSVTLIR
jgi:gliding motility-associated-like protein